MKWLGEGDFERYSFGTAHTLTADYSFTQVNTKQATGDNLDPRQLSL